MTKFLVTGGNGFVANNLIKVLGNSTANDINVSSRKFKSFEKARITIFDNMYLSDSTNWEQLLLHVDCIIHCAAHVHQSRLVMFFKPDSYNTVNKLATINLLEQAENMNVKHFIYISSLAASKGCNSSNPYSRSKYEAEQEIINFCKKSKIQYTILRPPLLYGVNAPGNFRKLMWLLKHIKIIPYPSKLNTIPVLFILNLINLIQLSVCNKMAYGKTFEISDKDKLNLKELIKLISELFNLKIFLIKIPTIFLRFINIFGTNSIFFNERVIDNSYLEKEMGWKPPFSTREALEIMSEEDQQLS